MGKDDPRGDPDPVVVVEKGNFTHASCACGWRGPGRRSRKKARQDAASHREERCAAVRKA